MLASDEKCHLCTILSALAALHCIRDRKNTYLFNRLKVVLHALDRDVFTSLDRLRLKNFGERAFSLFADKSVLLHLSVTKCVCFLAKFLAILICLKMVKQRKN